MREKDTDFMGKLESKIRVAIEGILPDGFILFDSHLNNLDSLTLFIDSPHGRDHISLIMVGTSTNDLKQLANHALKLIKAKYKEHGNG